MPRTLSRRLGRIAFSPFCRTKRLMSHAEVFMSQVEAFMSHVEAFMSHVEAFMSHVKAFMSHVEAFMSHVKAFMSHAEAFMSHVKAFMSHAEAFMSHAEAFMSHAEAFMSHAEGEPRWTARRAVLPVALDETHYRRLAASPLRRQDDGPVRQDVDPFTLWFVQILDVEAVFRTDDAHRGPCVAINAAVGTEVQRRAVG